MELLKYVKERKLGLSICLLLFILLMVSLVLRNIELEDNLYPASIFLMTLVFIFSQYFDFEYRYFIGFALVMLVACPFLLIGGYEKLAEYFANYVYGFLVLGIVCYFLDRLREKIIKKGYFKIITLSCLILIITVTPIIFYGTYFLGRLPRLADYTVITKNAIVKSSEFIKDKYLRTFNKEIYYSKKDFVIIDGVKVKEDIIIGIDSPKKDSYVSGIVNVKGWTIEKNLIYDSGIDRIEFFLGGKPGEGKYLGKFTQEYNPEIETINYIENLYINFYNRKPFGSELDFWAINLESNIMSYYDVAANIIINESNFMEKNLSNEDFLMKLYRGLLNKDNDGFWTDRLEADLTREDMLYIIINSIESNILSENYYESITIKENYLDIIRRDVGEKYGKQFALSGFSFEFDSTKFNNGKYEIYIYARSPDFGWDYEVIDININN